MKNAMSELSVKVVDALRGDDAVTVGQLRAVVGTELGASMGSMTMAEFLGAKPAKGKAKGSSKPAKAAKVGSVNTRTPEGRANYDAAVLAAVSKGGDEGVAASDVIKACGGTPLQARTALTRLINEEKLTWTGKARATRYMPAS